MADAAGRVVRMNDGNDSNIDRETVVASAEKYKCAFFNTSIPRDLKGFKRPVVLTLNPGTMTDSRFHRLSAWPANLMFVRFRVSTWNLELCDRAVEHYTSRGVPVVLTFLAFYETPIPEEHAASYEFRKRTLNSYWVITPAAWDTVVARYHDNPLVYTCGKDANTHPCARCGNCLREYFTTVVKTGTL